MTVNLSNRVAVITGASGNLGQATARAFRAAGAKLALIDRAANRLPAIYPELVTAPNVIFISPYDIGEPEAATTAIKKTMEKFGRIDILVNTVGGHLSGKPVHETDIEILDQMWNTNVRTAFLISHAVIPQMITQNAGKIIHISSRAGFVGNANSAAYSAAKSALLRLSESMAAELKIHNIQVNCVIPGTIDSPQNHMSMPTADTSRWVTPEAIAEVILFLASSAAAAVSGAAIPVLGKG